VHFREKGHFFFVNPCFASGAVLDELKFGLPSYEKAVEQGQILVLE